MPILSDLSRRFHLLTTDAKPDPPRLPIKGYTHNLEPSAVNEKTKKTEFVSAPTTEREKSVLNDTLPTNADHSTRVENDVDDGKTSANEAKQQKKPNVRTKAKSKQYKSSQGTHVVNYNIINSNGVKIGARTSYICNINQFDKNNAETTEESWLKSKSKIRQMPVEVQRLCACTDEITLDDIFVIKTYIGRGWKDVVRKLLYADGQIDQFEENYRFKGISEVIYQIFLDWKQANTKNAKIGNLVDILWSCREYDCVERLVSAHGNSM
ncbi:Receptor-interacting serine/threonine-protein kinase 1 [Habropoda laboriosa]|uniref:Receptor-interacting serine/threonine-protein kinase 1 n=1 Tax=Habropoda laboriosa TaxID=597456 RepID=A0A0L7QXH3_9HYME|nr:PREDICTED: uncharacterized protein LOC108574125 [Habropoda laboriosa]KOC63318.1 Receptor-interacting serine/threonine-protein kinase 1 [Habropoda laboriosa]